MGVLRRLILDRRVDEVLDVIDVIVHHHGVGVLRQLILDRRADEVLDGQFSVTVGFLLHFYSCGYVQLVSMCTMLASDEFSYQLGMF